MVGRDPCLGNHRLPDHRPLVVSFAELLEVADVLDLGCGRGSEAEALVERFPRWRITAPDYDPDMVGPAIERLSRFGERVTVEKADATASWGRVANSSWQIS